MCPLQFSRIFPNFGGICEVWTRRYGFLETQTKQSMCSLSFSTPILGVFSFNTYFAAIRNHIRSMKPGGERPLIVSPFHRLQAVKALCGSGSQSQTQALLHEKIQCIKQLGLKGKAARGYKLLFYVLLSFSLYVLLSMSLPPLSYSF